jgi:hypothetical protein
MHEIEDLENQDKEELEKTQDRLIKQAVRKRPSLKDDTLKARLPSIDQPVNKPEQNWSCFYMIKVCFRS